MSLFLCPLIPGEVIVMDVRCDVIVWSVDLGGAPTLTNEPIKYVVVIHLVLHSDLIGHQSRAGSLIWLINIDSQYWVFWLKRCLVLFSVKSIKPFQLYFSVSPWNVKLFCKYIFVNFTEHFMMKLLLNLSSKIESKYISSIWFQTLPLDF